MSARSIADNAPSFPSSFVLKSFSRAKRRVLLAVDDRYFAGRPFLNKLELRWYAKAEDEARGYEAGLAHVSQRGSIAFAGHQPKYRTRTVQSPATLLVYVGFFSGRHFADSIRPGKMVGSSHANLTIERFNSLNNSIVVRSNDDPVDLSTGLGAFIYVLNQELSGLSGERFPRVAGGCVTGGNYRNRGHSHASVARNGFLFSGT